MTDLTIAAGTTAAQLQTWAKENPQGEAKLASEGKGKVENAAKVLHKKEGATTPVLEGGDKRIEAKEMVTDRIKSILVTGDADGVEQRAFDDVFSDHSNDTPVRGSDIVRFQEKVATMKEASVNYEKVSKKVDALVANKLKNCSFDDAKELRQQLVVLYQDELLTDSQVDKVLEMVAALEKHQESTVEENINELMSPIMGSIRKQISDKTGVSEDKLPKSLHDVSAEKAELSMPGGVELNWGKMSFNASTAVRLLNSSEGTMRFTITHELGHLVDLTVKDVDNTALASAMDGDTSMLVSEEEVAEAYKELYPDKPDLNSMQFLEVLADVFAIRVLMNMGLTPTPEDVSESIGGPGDGDHPSGDVRKKMIEKLTGFKF